VVKDVGDRADTAVEESTSGPHAPTDPVADGATQTFVPTAVAKLTRTGAAVGTYAYMSPEQARGDRERIGPATDVWALGVILYELLAGYRPGEWPADTNPGRTPVPGPAIESEPIDPELKRIIDRCLPEDPAGRDETAGALAVGLRRWLEPPSVETRLRLPDRRMWIGAAAVGALGLAGTGYLVFRRKTNDPEAEREAARAWIRGELRDGRAVELIDVDGKAMPVFRFLAGGGASQVAEGGSWWTVSATRETLIEFLDDPGVERFTLKGQIRANRHADIPIAGLFVAHRAVSDAGKDWHFQLEYLYRESPARFRPDAPANPTPPVPPPKGGKGFGRTGQHPRGRWNGEGRVWLSANAFGGGDGKPEPLMTWSIEPDGPPGDGPTRDLAIRVAGQQFTVIWPGADDYTVDKINEKVLDRMRQLLNPQPDPPLAFSAQGGLGVSVQGGSASCRNLTLVPSWTG